MKPAECHLSLWLTRGWMSEEADQFCNSSPESAHIDGPHIDELRTSFPVIRSFTSLLWKPFNKKKTLKSWTHLKGRSTETWNHHRDNNDGNSRDDLFSRDGSVLGHYINKLTLSGEISIWRHHSSSAPQLCRHHPALESSIHMEELQKSSILPNFERRFWVQQQQCRSARLGSLWNCWN